MMAENTDINLPMSLEKILLTEAVGEKDLAVVPRRYLFGGEYWSGVRRISEDEIFALLSKHMEFHERTDELERNHLLKQIIPYFLIKKSGGSAGSPEPKYLSARRKNKTGDTRLHGASLVGFGGHLRAGDIKGAMKDWLRREFEEEISTEEIKGISFLGLVNDDSDADNGVHKVHMGLIFEVEVEGAVSIKEKESFENEKFSSLEKLRLLTPEMELWSRLVVDSLK